MDLCYREIRRRYTVKRNLDGYMNLNWRHIKMEIGFRGDLSPVLSWESNKFSLTRKGESSVIVVIHGRKKKKKKTK